MADENPVPFLKRLKLAEMVLGLIALLIIAGWILKWSQSGLKLDTWIPLLNFFLSFIGALVVVAILIHKVSGKMLLQEKMERLILSVSSLAPIVGFLIEEISTPARCFTVGGSIALAYISATTYWRKHIPPIALNPLGESEEKETVPPQAEKSPP